MIEEGRIVHNQVTYDSLTPADWGVLESKGKEPSSDTVEEDVEEEQKITRQQSAARTMEKGLTEADMARLTGDTECYKIYLGSLGWKVLAVSFLLMGGHAVLEIMPRMSRL